MSSTYRNKLISELAEALNRLDNTIFMNRRTEIMAECFLNVLQRSIEIEKGAKAAYGAVFEDGINWPQVSSSVSAQQYREAAAACVNAVLGIGE